MKFRTEYIARLNKTLQLDPERPVVLLGSCFSENIGKRMRKALWNACVNPTGVLFNPITIAQTLKNSMHSGEVDVVEKNGMVFCWDSDSSFSGLTKEECVAKVSQARHTLHDSLLEAQALILTLGTARVYELVEQPGRVVANCHKFPSGYFNLRMIDVDEVCENLFDILVEISNINPEIKFIFTVSPVRHVRDGFVENTRSKSTLVLGVEKLISGLSGKGLCADYFPAYEIMIDDLRDYRFFDSDLVHPSAEGVEYIWEKFKETYLSQVSQKLLEQSESLVSRYCHHPLFPKSKEYSLFREKLNGDCESFRISHPRMLLPGEIVT